jgi:hypothetical protein
MNEQELRAMIRESIARRLGPDQPALAGATVRLKPDTTYDGAHASHLRLPLVSGDEDGACVIEPSVRCNHCGYCLSLGH